MFSLVRFTIIKTVYFIVFLYINQYHIDKNIPATGKEFPLYKISNTKIKLNPLQPFNMLDNDLCDFLTLNP